MDGGRAGVTMKDAHLPARVGGFGNKRPGAQAHFPLRVGSGQPRLRGRQILHWGFLPLLGRLSLRP